MHKKQKRRKDFVITKINLDDANTFERWLADAINWDTDVDDIAKKFFKAWQEAQILHTHPNHVALPFE
jgi:hypothetical protein